MANGYPDVWRAYVASIARNVAGQYEAQLDRMETLMVSTRGRDDSYRFLYRLPLGRKVEVSIDAEAIACIHERDGNVAEYIERSIVDQLKADGDARVKELAARQGELWRPTDG